MILVLFNLICVKLVKKKNYVFEESWLENKKMWKKFVFVLNEIRMVKIKMVWLSIKKRIGPYIPYIPNCLVV